MIELMCIIAHPAITYLVLLWKKKVFHWISLQCQPSAICHTQQKEPKKNKKKCFRRLVLGWGEGVPKKTQKKVRKKQSTVRLLKLCFLLICFCLFWFRSYASTSVITMQQVMEQCNSSFWKRHSSVLNSGLPLRQYNACVQKLYPLMLRTPKTWYAWRRVRV